MVKWFGKNWGAPVCNEAEQVRTPVGELCAHCLDPIEAQDDGFVLDAMLVTGPARVPYHYACHLRGVFGGVLHQQRKCSCYVSGATETDPPELTKREAAEYAVRLWEANNALRRD